MFPLPNKTCTWLSIIFLVCCIPLITLILISWLMWDIFPSFVKILSNSGTLMYYSWYLCSGISLIFSTGIHSKTLKRWIAFIHFSCVYYQVMLVVPLLGGGILIVAGVAYLLLLRMTQSEKTQKCVLGLPMLVSLASFIRINYYFMTFNGEIITCIILMSFSG